MFAVNSLAQVFTMWSRPKPSQSRKFIEQQKQPPRPKPSSCKNCSTNQTDWKTPTCSNWSEWSDWSDWQSFQDCQSEDCQSDNEATIARTKQILQRFCGDAPVHGFCHRAGKRGRTRRGRRNKVNRASLKCAKARYEKLDDKSDNNANAILCRVDVEGLRYSQESCKGSFQCGRSVLKLVKSLWEGKVSVSAPFLKLTVFETTDTETHEPILRCIDNRRLYALKAYAKLLDDPVMVDVNLFTNATLMEVQRFIQNSDNTDGRSIRMRKNQDKLHQPLT